MSKAGKVPCKLAQFAADMFSQHVALPYSFSVKTAIDIIHNLAGTPINP